MHAPSSPQTLRRAKKRSCYFQMLLFFCPSVTWLAFYICNTQKLGLLFKRGRGRERECQMEKCHCSHISIRAAAAAARWQMGIPQKCEALVIWEITKHHQPSSPLQELLIIGKPGNRRKCRRFCCCCYCFGPGDTYAVAYVSQWNINPESNSFLNKCTVCRIKQSTKKQGNRAKGRIWKWWFKKFDLSLYLENIHRETAFSPDYSLISFFLTGFP